jgi:hypothetical protein
MNQEGKCLKRILKSKVNLHIIMSNGSGIMRRILLTEKWVKNESNNLIKKDEEVISNPLFAFDFLFPGNYIWQSHQF